MHHNKHLIAYMFISMLKKHLQRDYAIILNSTDLVSTVICEKISPVVNKISLLNFYITPNILRNLIVVTKGVFFLLC